MHPPPPNISSVRVLLSMSICSYAYSFHCFKWDSNLQISNMFVMVELYLWPGGLVDLLVTGDIALLPKSTARSCQSAGRTYRQHDFPLIIPSCLLLIIHCKKTTCLSILTVRTSNISPGPKFTPGFSLWRLASYYYQWSGVLASGLSLPQIRFHKCFTIITNDCYVTIFS